MKYGNDKGVKTSKWFPNEIFKDVDINRIGEQQYLNLTDMLASLSQQDKQPEIFRGLDVEFSTAFTVKLKAGVAISYTGKYFDDGSFGFVSEPGTPFLVIVPSDVLIGIDNASGQVGTRRDSIEIRPVQRGYNSESRSFKDPSTGIVSPMTVNTGLEYGYEFAVRKGTPTNVLRPTRYTLFEDESGGSGYYEGTSFILGLKITATQYPNYYRKNVLLWFNTAGRNPLSDDARDRIFNEGLLYAEIIVDIGEAGSSIASKVHNAISSFSGSGQLGIISSIASDRVNFHGRTAGYVYYSGTATNLFPYYIHQEGKFVNAPDQTPGWLKIAEIIVDSGITDLDEASGYSPILSIDRKSEWHDYNSINYTIPIRWDPLNRLDAVEADVDNLKIDNPGRTPIVTRSSGIAPKHGIGIGWEGKTMKAGFEFSTGFPGLETTHTVNDISGNKICWISPTRFVYVSAMSGHVYNIRIGEINFSNGTTQWVSNTTGFSLTDTYGRVCIVRPIYKEDYFIIVFIGFNDSTLVRTVFAFVGYYDGTNTIATGQPLTTIGSYTYNDYVIGLSYPHPGQFDTVILFYKASDSNHRLNCLRYNGSWHMGPQKNITVEVPKGIQVPGVGDELPIAIIKITNWQIFGAICFRTVTLDIPAVYILQASNSSLTCTYGRIYELYGDTIQNEISSHIDFADLIRITDSHLRALFLDDRGVYKTPVGYMDLIFDVDSTPNIPLLVSCKIVNAFPGIGSAKAGSVNNIYAFNMKWITPEVFAMLDTLNSTIRFFRIDKSGTIRFVVSSFMGLSLHDLLGVMISRSHIYNYGTGFITFSDHPESMFHIRIFRITMPLAVAKAYAGDYDDFNWTRDAVKKGDIVNVASSMHFRPGETAMMVMEGDDIGKIYPERYFSVDYMRKGLAIGRAIDEDSILLDW